jgi:hypothetical protein
MLDVARRFEPVLMRLDERYKQLAASGKMRTKRVRRLISWLKRLSVKHCAAQPHQARSQAIV